MGWMDRQCLYYLKRHGLRCTMNFMLNLQKIQEKYFYFIHPIQNNSKSYRWVLPSVKNVFNCGNIWSQAEKIYDIISITFQKAFRNFLEMACHCVVLDLFDEALFQTICYDPEKWLANLLKVIDFQWCWIFYTCKTLII